MKSHGQKSINQLIEGLNKDVYLNGGGFPKHAGNRKFSLINQLAFIAVILALIVLAMSFSVRAQSMPTTNFGNAAELRGVKSLIVKTGEDEKSRKAIIREISLKLPHLHIAENTEETNIALVYRTEASQKKMNEFLSAPKIISSIAPFSTNRANYSFAEAIGITPQTQDFISGIGYVVKTNELAETRQILMIFESDRLQGSFERDPAVKFARAFVKTYLKANAGSNVRW